MGLYDRMNGIGAHEVIIETPDHALTLADLPPKHLEDILWAYRDRMVDLKRDFRFRFILIFKNHGAAAGATLEHTHSQLIALPIVPTNVAAEIEGCRSHYSAERTLHLLRHHSPGAQRAHPHRRRQSRISRRHAVCPALSF